MAKGDRGGDGSHQGIWHGASGTPASGTPASGTRASGTPASGPADEGADEGTAVRSSTELSTLHSEPPN